MSDDAAPRQSFADKHRKVLLGLLAVAIFFAAWQAVFLVVPFNPLFISKPDLIWRGLRRSARQRRPAARSRRQRGAVPLRLQRGGGGRRLARRRHGLAGARRATRSIR